MGADPNWTERDGLSALQVVLKKSKFWGLDASDAVEIAMTLLDAGAVLNGGELFDSILLDNRTLTHRLFERHRLGTSQLDESLSVLEAAIAMDDQYLITQILTQHPGAYDAGALCSSVLFEDHGLRTVKFLLRNRPQAQRVLPLESLAIGIAAWRDRVDLLDLLLTKVRKPSTATLPRIMRDSFCVQNKDTFTGIETAKSQRRLFWREKDQILISPLTLALKTKNSLARLLEHGFLPDRLTMSVVAVSGDHALIRKLSGYPMLTHGFTDFEGPLAATVRRNDIDVVKSLLDGNCYVNEDHSLVDSGRSPLQIAVECGYSDLIKLLLDAGADVNAPAADWCGATALQLSAITGYLGVTKMLVDHGADLNAPGALCYGRTALEGAAEHGRIDTIQYLLSEGVETNGKGRLSYLRAIRYAELEVHVVAVNLLKTWREWTSNDDALWDKLKSLSKDACEEFEDPAGSESELERQSPGKANDDNVMQDAVLDDAYVAEAQTREISATENSAVGILSELEDLEMMTSDTFTFWSGFDLS
ncbi:Ankyrin-2 [Colletotrichum siamense]|nr:Ankyrin-2 [Colletotrichum siamense]